MDLIFMNASREDIGVLQDYELDLAFGADENNFECRIQAQAHCCEAGFFLYAEGTEYGGIIDSITSDTEKKEIIYSGRTWQGILNSKIIEPDKGADYLIVSGDANDVLRSLVARLALSDMFEGSSEVSGIGISNYRMHRYVSGYDGIRKMLESVGGKLNFAFKNGKVVLSVLPIHDYSQDEEFDADLVSFKAVRNYKAINHLICLGSGELADRLVVHLYADTDGNISQTQTQFGMDEVSAIYEYSNIGDEAELIAEGTERFKGMLSADEISIDFDSNDDKYDVGDIIGAYDPITNLFATAPIAKKIVTIKDGRITISLTPDESKGGIAMEVGGASSGGGGKEVQNRGCAANLLDNSNFRNPINQRCKTHYSGAAAFCIDRWKIGNTAVVGECDITADGITLRPVDGSCDFSQRFEAYDSMKGKRFTFAYMGTDETVHCTTFAMGGCYGASAGKVEFFSLDGLHALIRVTEDVTIAWAAIYEGEYTAETLPNYQYKGYAAELAECQRYYYQSFTGNAPSNKNVLAVASAGVNTLQSIRYPVQMRESPHTVTLYSNITGNPGAVCDWATDIDIDGVAAYAAYSGENGFVAFKTFGFEANKVYGLHYSASADL